jgi:hypothetical protein
VIVALGAADAAAGVVGVVAHATTSEESAIDAARSARRGSAGRMDKEAKGERSGFIVRESWPARRDRRKSGSTRSAHD